jgi:signal transduction histidine kinase
MLPTTALAVLSAVLGLLAGAGGAALALGRRARAQAEAERRLAEEERRHAVGVLSAEVAHELTAVRLYLQDVLAHAPLEPEDRDIGREELARLERLLAHLRRARREEEAPAPLALRPLAARALSRLAGGGPKRLRTVLDVPAGLEVRGGALGLELLLGALVRNAAAAAPPGGTVAVRAREAGGQLLLAVEDDGPGLPEALRSGPPRHPLQALERGGAGTGLAVARSMARVHQGRLTLARDGGRTVARLELPLSAAPPGGGAPPSPKRSAAA